MNTFVVEWTLWIFPVMKRMVTPITANILITAIVVAIVAVVVAVVVISIIVSFLLFTATIS